jgi:hypothetical protein
MHQVEQTQQEKEEGKQVTLVSMFFKKSTTDDIRRYNIPKIGEVAVVFNGEDGVPSTNDIVIYPQNNTNSNAAFSL